MCCSAWPVHFSKTITGTWEVMVEDVLRHVIWYQNRVGGNEGRYGAGVRDQVLEVIVRQAIAGAPWERLFGQILSVNNIDPDEVREELAHRSDVSSKPRTKKPEQLKSAAADAQSDVQAGGNCLIIPIMGSWESILLLNTSDTPDLLSDIDKALALPTALGAGWGAPIQERFVPAGGAGGRLVFMQFDVYDIVLAENASMIGKVLPQINEKKRPAVNPEVFDTLEKWYQCPVAVCCFKGDEQAEAKPIGFSFEPRDASKLIVYTLDGHNGRAPDPDATVIIDHTIFVGSHLTHPRFQAELHYRNQIPDHLAPYVLKHAMGMPIHKSAINGDTVFDVEDVRNGFFSGTRVLPPYAPARQPTSDHIFRDDFYNNGNRSQVKMRGPV